MARFNRWWQRFICLHTHERQVQIANTKTMALYCPTCSRVRWVD